MVANLREGLRRPGSASGVLGVNIMEIRVLYLITIGSLSRSANREAVKDKQSYYVIFSDQVANKLS